MSSAQKHIRSLWQHYHLQYKWEQKFKISTQIVPSPSIKVISENKCTYQNQNIHLWTFPAVTTNQPMIIQNADPFQASTPHCITVSPCKSYPSSQDRVAMYPKVVPLASAKPLTGAGSPQSGESKSKCLYQSKCTYKKHHCDILVKLFNLMRSDLESWIFTIYVFTFIITHVIRYQSSRDKLNNWYIGQSQCRYLKLF